MRGDPLARNIAEVIDGLYAEHSPPRDHDRLIALIQHQIEHVQWVTAKPLREEIERLGKEVERLCADTMQLLEEVEHLRADTTVDVTRNRPETTPGGHSRRMTKNSIPPDERHLDSGGRSHARSRPTGDEAHE
jgi:predicted RNase H-like nuclease (RuvC/YqgF family)